MSGRRPSFAALIGVGGVTGLLVALVMVGVAALFDANLSGAVVGAVAGAVAGTAVAGPTNGQVGPPRRDSMSWGIR